MAEILGRTTGCVGGVGGSMHLSSKAIGLMPTMAIIGAGIPIAAGVAWGAQLRGGDDVAVSIFGDGTANIGAFHEGLNIAAVWRLPVIFVCENNLYGEYSPLATTTAVKDIAERATLVRDAVGRRGRPGPRRGDGGDRRSPSTGPAPAADPPCWR